MGPFAFPLSISMVVSELGEAKNALEPPRLYTGWYLMSGVKDFIVFPHLVMLSSTKARPLNRGII